MTTTRGLASLLVTALVGAAGSAYAQAAAPGGALGSAPTKDRFAGTVGFRVLYDNNAGGGSAAIAQVRGLATDDITYLPTASIAIHQMVGRQAVFLEATGDIERHDKNRQLDSENGSVNAGAQAHLGPCESSLTGNYSKRRTSTNELLTAVTKNITTQSGGFAEVGCNAGAFVAGITGGRAHLANSGKSGGYADSTSDTVGFQAGFQNKRAGALSFTAQYARVGYDSPLSILGVPTNPGFQSYAGGLMYKRMIGRRLDGQASISYSVIDSKGAPTVFRSWTSNTNLNYRVSSRANLNFSYNRSVEPSPYASANYKLHDSLNLSGSYALTKRLNFNLGGSIDKSHLKGSVPLLRQVREDRNKIIFASGSLKIGRNLSVVVSAQHSDRTSDLPEFDVASDHISVGLLSLF